ncbi:hypothetical protein T440DRAFT_244878 [Plenodomus tracheiphilus IPT5]|uniref:Zn(2)-C6 fungal-type domain-containing protein n=1 Tax=Plenodomus tracheiphilus IPT5 TaxID=1408161 RepID=A0A6A7BHK5_9PLEO|nr:hypothetical protein T440DRAFT_244878 [Plenodomus tracheiphilus IPT5]
MIPASQASASPVAATSSNATHSRRVPLDKRKRTETSCDKCKSRKQKCRKEPGQESCKYCTLHHIQCQTTQPRKKRLYGSVEGLGTRIALLESLVKGLVPEADVSNVESLRQLAHSLGIPLPDTHLGEANGEAESSDKEGEDAMSLLPDQQGQVQYIGPASSLAFHFKLRTLVGRGAKREFTLFGKNAAEQELNRGGNDPHALSTPAATSNVREHLPIEHHNLPGTRSPGFESLISAFFERINPDVPVLHEASFREAYEAWLVNHDNFDPAWLCSFLCVLLLARRVARVTFPEEQEKVWWRRVQTLLPVVIFTTSVTAVQALMLAAIHLHNTNHRDACWNLTGTAVRIAYAIGLHQDKASAGQTPVSRELRKQLWWTLYSLEQAQVTSYDRPGAIEHPGPKIGCPNEKILGMASYYPLDYRKWMNRLMGHMGSACRAPKTVKQHASEESYVGPLSPAAAVLRDLQRWMDSLPRHLRIETIDSSLQIFQRPLSLLHAWYHYIVIVLCRAALLARASILSKEGHDSTNPALIAMANSCSESGQDLARILLRLDAFGKFDPFTTCDVWFTLASSSVLVLDLVCMNKFASPSVCESRILLSQLADLAQRQRRNPYMPGTLEKFASIIPELHSMVDALDSAATPAEDPIVKAVETVAGVSCPPPQPHHDPGPYQYLQSSTHTGGYMFADNMQDHYQHDPAYPVLAGYSNARFDRATQSHFMDFTINNIHDWNWGDLSNILGTEAVPNMHTHGQAPPGPPPVGPS